MIKETLDYIFFDDYKKWDNNKKDTFNFSYFGTTSDGEANGINEFNRYSASYGTLESFRNNDSAKKYFVIF